MQNVFVTYSYVNSVKECIEEDEQQSSCSPGTVRDEESLARFIYRSDHLADDGELAPAAFPVQDFLDRGRGGLSVARLDHMTPIDVQRHVVALVGSGNARATKGMAVAETRGIRAIRNDGARTFCVVDDGKPDFQAHAATRLADSHGMSRSSVRRVRRQLMRSFSFQPSG